MADTVRRTLEEMVPELEDLERRGYFNKDEIRQIIQRRQDFEYALRRRAALKADFLRYVDYETSLDRLRQLRRKQRGITGTATLADYCIVRRTHFIFERATRKFRGDLALWSRWLRFCQTTGSSRHMSRVLTRALQLHSTCAALWTYAAAWEFEHNANAVAARALMQRGLRMCKDAPGLWHEYFRLELLYAARLVARRKVLGIALAAGEEPAPAKQGRNNSDGDDSGDEKEAEIDEAAVEAVLKGAVARVVYSNAVQTVKDSLPFRSGFLDILQSVDLPGRTELESFILEDIFTSFQDTPGAIDLQARRQLATDLGDNEGRLTPSIVESAFAVFEQALASSPSQALWDAALSFVEDQVQDATQAEDAACATALVQKCLDIVTRAVQSGQASEYIVLAAPKVHLRLGQLAEAAAAAAGAAGVSLPAVIRQHIVLHSLTSSSAAQTGSSSSSGNGSMFYLEAVKAAGGDGRQREVWLAAIRSAVAAGSELKTFSKLLLDQQRGSGRGPLRGGMGVPAACLLTAIWSTAGPAAARKLYRPLLAVPLPGGEFVHAILDCELTLLAAAGNEQQAALSIAQVIEIFEAGVTAFGAEDEDLWMRYVQFEQRFGGNSSISRGGASTGAGTVHWRAVKALDNADAFVARSHLANAGFA